MNQVILSVKVKVKSGFFDEVFESVKTLHTLTHQEDRGCLQYDLFKVIDDENSFSLFERWENQELLDEHMQKEHFLEFQKFTEDKVEYVKIDFLDKV